MTQSEKHIVMDLGNSYLKSKAIGQKKSIHAIPHAVKWLDGGTWVLEAEAAKRGSRSADRDNTKIFKMQNRGVMVGAQAFRANYTAPTVGEGKYTKSYFRYLVASQLLHHCPNGHDNLTLHVAHPPNAIPYLTDLMKSVGGKYNITLADGTRVNYMVKRVTAWDEPSGSMYTLLGGNNRYDFHDGDTIFLCDFGGRISSMTTVEVRRSGDSYQLIPYFDDDSLSVTFDGGAQTIMASLADQLTAFHADEIKGIATSLERNFSLLEGVFRNRGKLSLRGVQHDVSVAFSHAITPFLDLVTGHFERRGITSTMVALTGGSTQPLWDYLVNDDDRVINHNNIRAVTALNDIRFANIRGAEKSILKSIGGE